MREYTFHINRGFKWQTRVQAFDDSDVAIDLSEHTSGFTIYDRFGNTVDVTSTSTITDNQIDVSISTSETAKLTETHYTYKLHVEKDSEKLLILSGKLNIL